jgi:hypothetical protein
MDSNAVLPNREWKKVKGRRFLPIRVDFRCIEGPVCDNQIRSTPYVRQSVAIYLPIYLMYAAPIHTGKRSIGVGRIEQVMQ